MGDKIVLNYHNSLLRDSDVKILKQNEWLNDQVIGFWLEYLENDLFANSNKCESISFVSPEVAQFLKLSTGQDASIFIESLGLMSKSLVLLPINDSESPDVPGGSHWSLLVYQASNKKFYHLDSSHQSNFSEAEKTAFKLGLPLAERVISKLNCTQQDNSWDCGIFTCCHAELIVTHYPNEIEGLPLLSMSTARNQRTRMMKIITELSSRSV